MDHLLSALLLCSCATPIYTSTSDVNQASFGSFDFKELEEVLYDVEIGISPTTVADFDSVHNIQQDMESSNSRSTDETQKVPKSRRLTLISKYGQKYFCMLPEGVPVDVEDESTEDRVKFNASALLQPLTERPCLRRTTGWWTYEYCHGKVITQFHKEAGEATKTLLLGVYENETLWTEEKIDRVNKLKNSMENNLSNQHYPLSYHGLTYVNGTVCDITGKPRRARVKIFCGIGEDKILDIQETETCSYNIHVQTSLLCTHPFFRMKSGKKSHLLECSPIISEQYYYDLQKGTVFGNPALFLEEECQSQPTKDDDKHERTSKKQTFTSVLNSFSSRSDLFDSGYDEDDDLIVEGDTRTKRGLDIGSDDERGTDSYSERTDKHREKVSVSRESNPYQQHHQMPKKLTNKELDDSEEEKLALRLNKLKTAVDSLYKRMIEEFEDFEEDHQTKNLLRHAIRNKKDSENSDIQSESDNADTFTRERDQAPQTHQQDEHYSKTGRTTISEQDVGSRTRDELIERKHERLKEIIDKEEEPQTVVEYLEKLKARKKKTSSSFSADDPEDGELSNDELDLFEEFDEESLAELETEMNEELQRYLQEAGLDQAQVEVKVFNLPASIIDNLDHIEDEGEDVEADTSSQKKSTIKVLNVRLAGDQLLDGSKRSENSATVSQDPNFAKMLNNFLNPMTPERVKVQELEKGYNQRPFESRREDDGDSDEQKNKLS